MSEPVPCHIEEPHGPHPWAPMVADPEHDRVLHILGVTVDCPGVKRCRCGGSGWVPDRTWCGQECCPPLLNCLVCNPAPEDHPPPRR